MPITATASIERRVMSAGEALTAMLWPEKNSADEPSASAAQARLEARPANEPARATMQTKSGAGFGTADRR